MSPTAALTPPPFNATTAFRRLTLDEYHRLIDVGILTDEDQVELLEGYMVLQTPKNPPHDSAIRKLTPRLSRVTPTGWAFSSQTSVTFLDSEPEPDFTFARGNETDFDTRHPGPTDIGLLIEVSDSSLARDRSDKGRIYARESIPVYWIVNVVDRQIEVYTDPTGPVSAPVYRRRQDYVAGSVVPIVLDGTTVGTLAVDDVLP